MLFLYNHFNSDLNKIQKKKNIYLLKLLTLKRGGYGILAILTWINSNGFNFESTWCLLRFSLLLGLQALQAHFSFVIFCLVEKGKTSQIRKPLQGSQQRFHTRQRAEASESAQHPALILCVFPHQQLKVFVCVSMAVSISHAEGFVGKMPPPGKGEKVTYHLSQIRYTLRT